ncbi:putative integral membrane protein [Theileria parva strain Muguga]|uniref:Uncharacterized protein n=1 Tax=Theileria parva TaxID=5875 RepID=Q4N1S6_THEPA|nr:putative integral membrane protein [Theileria parva strain Muguga]EAN32006.1 putative integral membrane protein [Theileria parva strain Muguga]|eukprot:XP_764289.1 hypothetical protein [Theileria parva strain Muguga]
MGSEMFDWSEFTKGFTNPSHFKSNWLPELLSGLASFSSFIIIHLLSICSRHIAVAFKVPDQNIGIYLSKLYGLRASFIFLGSALECIVNYYGFLEREWMSFFSFCLIFFVRFAFVMCLYVSQKPALHAYYILNLEAFFFGIFQMSYFSLIPKFAPRAAVFLDFSSVFVAFMQFLFDLCMFDEPIMILKSQAWLCILFTLVSCGGWYYYLFLAENRQSYLLDCDKEEKEEDNQFKCLNFKKYEYRKDMYKFRCQKRFRDHLKKVRYPFVILFLIFTLRNILYPSILPYGLLNRDDCHNINLFIPVALVLGSLTIYMTHGFWTEFKTRPGNYNLFFLLLFVPMIIITIVSISALHSETCFAKYIKGSPIRVLFLLLGLLYCSNVMQSLSYVAVANYVYYQSKCSPTKLSVLALHNLVASVCRYFTYKIGVGYACCRVENAYAMTVFHPTYRMNNIEATYYWVTASCKRAYKDVFNDFNLNIQEYI